MTANQFRLYLAALLTLLVVGILWIGLRATKASENYSEPGRFTTVIDGNGNVWIIDSQTAKIMKRP